MRSADEPEGLPNLSPVQQANVDNGNAFAKFTAEVINIIIDKGSYFQSKTITPHSSGANSVSLSCG